MYLHNVFTHCARRGWRLGTEDNVLNFEFALMCINVVFMNLRIMDVVFVISLTHKHFIDLPPPQLRPLSCAVVILVLWRFHCPHLHRQYLLMMTCINIFTWLYSEFNKPAKCNNFHIAIFTPCCSVK